MHLNTADRFKIIDRGYKEGYFADLVVFETGKNTQLNEEQKSSVAGLLEGWEIKFKS